MNIYEYGLSVATSQGIRQPEIRKLVAFLFSFTIHLQGEKISSKK